jgi:hypothetical protein
MRNHLQPLAIMRVLMAKSEAIQVRVEPRLKRALEKAAADDRRSVASLVEIITSEWLSARGYLDEKKTRV